MSIVMVIAGLLCFFLGMVWLHQYFTTKPSRREGAHLVSGLVNMTLANMCFIAIIVQAV